MRARQQIDLLQPVEKIGAKYRILADERNHLSLQQAAAATFFQQQIIDIFQPEIDRQRAKLSEFEEAIGRLETQLSEQREKIRRLRNEIEEAGGKRLQQLPDLIRLEQERLERKQENFLRYEELCRNCQIHVQVLTSEQFRQIRPQIDQLKDSIEAELTRLKHQTEEKIGKRARLNDDLLREVQELQELEKRSSKLPPRFASMRSQICRALHLDESALPFAAELISVSPAESHWEASVEMVLRSFGLSLLIPLEFHSRVRGYVEGHRMEDQYGHGARIDYLCVGKAGASSGDRIHQKSLFHKLQFKQHSMTPWIKAQVLRRFDFQCCDSVDEFNRIPKNALTANRHVKINAELHKKDDRSQIVDPRHFVLGWDNTDKKRRIKSRIAELEVERDQQSELIQKWDCQLTAHAETQRAATELLAVTDFESINFQHHEREIDALQQELRELKESNETVKLLAQRLHAAEGVEQQLEQERTTSLTTKGSLTTQIQQDERLVASAVSAVNQAEKMGVYEEHASQFAAIRIALGQPEPTAADFSTRKAEWEAETNRRLASLASSVDEVSGKLTAAMTRFLREFKEESDDLHASPQSLDSFLGVLDQLRREDLPRYERKFKERLNEEVTKEVALFNNALRQEEKEIADKITQLNIALANVDYDANRGTYMRLDPRRVNDKEIESFRRSLRECLDDSLDSSDEANQVRFQRIQTLVERLADKERATWRSKVTDVRNWYDFAALEMERDSKVVKSCYDGSSGQSGGEKAKLAFTILVAALAYQFDVDPSGETAGRFQFVVVDEMFSKVDDQNACYALRLFQQFGLQLLIVAPLDAKARVTEPFVDRYLHVVKDASTQRSQMFSMTAQEYDEVLQGFASNGKPRQARSQRDNESLRSSR
ncbi:hypothetical protein GYB59_01305 [bacterium]|nr:hypothetical protein [bacterium]